jgi:hypothetical protein
MMKRKVREMFDDIYVTWTERGLWLFAVLWGVRAWFKMRAYAVSLERRVKRLWLIISTALDGTAEAESAPSAKAEAPPPRSPPAVPHTAIKLKKKSASTTKPVPRA